ncbi:MAG: phosphopantothenoylcysteine decarboxylase [Deltaproteobacteria bacterium RBG_13_65_10]|nr:MAG: phosphopantothenoylcysteine decarboxylase [Deltaproteobacteria bacterium RBG_13_65_10]
MISGSKILLGVCGGIAAYKAAELARRLKRAGADVRAILTASGQRFVTPLTFQALTQNPVSTDLFDTGQEQQIGHIDLADWADVFVIAPATANVIARLAAGMADNLLTTVALATRARLVIAPAMNVHMFRHPAVRRNLDQLREAGAHIVDPTEGEMACGHVGEGRLAEIEDIVEGVARVLTPPALSGVSVLVTAGPTTEPVDPVRVLSNRSSGKMGYAIARAAWRRGATVVLVSGPVGESLWVPRGVEVVRVETASEMRRAVLERFPKAAAVVMAAAVSDYRPRQCAPAKIKKGKASLAIDLVRTTDILSELGRAKGSRVLVGFAAETERVVEHAREKLRGKKLDLIVANDVTAEGAGFSVDTNRVTILDREGGEEDLPLLSKDETADIILDRLCRLITPPSAPHKAGSLSRRET